MKLGFSALMMSLSRLTGLYPRFFPHLPLLLHIHLHLHLGQAQDTLVPALVATAVHGVEAGLALSQEVDLMLGDLDHVTDKNNLLILHAVCLTGLAMNMTHLQRVTRHLLVTPHLLILLLLDIRHLPHLNRHRSVAPVQWN